MVANVEILVNKDHKMTLQEEANRFSIGKALVHQLLQQKIGVSKVSARWMPKELTEYQKASRLTIAKEHLGQFNHDENKILNTIVTGNEMWNHYAEPETKAQSKQWKLASSPPPMKFKLSPSAGKIMLVAFFGIHME